MLALRLVALLLGLSLGVATPLSTRPVDIIEAWTITFLLEGEEYPVGTGSLSNAVDNGHLCVDAPEDWSSITIAHESGEVAAGIFKPINKLCEAKVGQ